MDTDAQKNVIRSRDLARFQACARIFKHLKDTLQTTSGFITLT